MRPQVRHNMKLLEPNTNAHAAKQPYTYFTENITLLTWATSGDIGKIGLWAANPANPSPFSFGDYQYTRFTQNITLLTWATSGDIGNVGLWAENPANPSPFVSRPNAEPFVLTTYDEVLTATDSQGNTTNITYYTTQQESGQNPVALTPSTYIIDIPEFSTDKSLGGLGDYSSGNEITLNIKDLETATPNFISDNYNISKTPTELYDINDLDELSNELGRIGENDIFFDKDYILSGDTLTYTVSGGNAVLTNGRIAFTANGGDSTTITITATDLEGHSASVYFSFAVATNSI